MARRRDVSKSDILDQAQHLMQRRGSQGWSVRDLAQEVMITSASLLYHYPTKDQLIATVFWRYRDRLNRGLSEVEAETESWPDRQRAVASLLARLCGSPPNLCLLTLGAAEFPQLTPQAREEVAQLLSNAQGWLARFLNWADASGEVTLRAPLAEEAQQWLAALLGERLMARLQTA